MGPKSPAVLWRIIAEIQPVTGGHPYLFPCQGKRGRPMCENTINLALQRLGYGGGRMSAHGFRAMASTLLNESGSWTPDSIERQLAHGDKDAVRRIYARGEYWDERVRMMQAWSNQLDVLRAAAANPWVRPSKAAYAWHPIREGLPSKHWGHEMS